MARRLEYYTYAAAESQNPNPEDPPLPIDAIVMGTPVASLVRDRKAQDGNAGAHARELARRLGTTVVAYQDLGPKVTFPELRHARHNMHPSEFPEYATEIAEPFAAYLATRGIQRLAFRIHSGNGPLGTQLARSFQDNPKSIAVTHLAISDPAGLKPVSSFRTGLKMWTDYRLGPERQMPANQRADAEQPANTIQAFISDIAVRGVLWRTSITLDNLRFIRTDMPNTAVLLHLPGNTFNGAPDDMRELAASLPDRAQGETPFVVEFCPADYHGTTYDSFAGNEAFMRRALELPAGLV